MDAGEEQLRAVQGDAMGDADVADVPTRICSAVGRAPVATRVPSASGIRARSA
ncbi:hypothetical protein [Microlunatus soli]